MAKKKVTLPFLVAPRRAPVLETLGDEDSGQIEIERKGYLTVAEKSFMQQAGASDETVGRLQRLSGKISRENGVQAQEVIQKLGEGDLGADCFIGYEEEVDELISVLSVYEQRRKAIAASCLILFRLSQDWTIDQTMNLHPDLVEELYDLFLDEDNRSTEAFEKNEEELVTEGK
jgi:hypothetical protein